MKRLAICLVAVFILAIPVYAGTVITEEQTENARVQGTDQMKCPTMRMRGQCMMQGGQQMPIMHAVQRMQTCPGEGQIMWHGIMARDMMQIMTDIIKMQEKMIRGLSPVEKIEMQKDTGKMIEKLEIMMSEIRGMMMRGIVDQPAPAATRMDPPIEEQGGRPPLAPHH